ncbi:MAG: acetylxylan esterase [Terracidiphilus sp.]
MLSRAPLLVLILAAVPLAAQSTPAPRPQTAPPAAKPAPAQAANPGAPLQLSAAEDRFRLIRLLGLQHLRPPQSGDANSPNSCNYDEAKANPYPNLPNPLQFDDGSRVTSAQQWFSRRRTEIEALYDREVLGRTPPNLPKVSWKVVEESPANLGGVDVTMRHVVGHVDNAIDPAITVDIQLLLAIPAHARGRVPVVMELEFPEDFDKAMAKRLASAFAGPWAHYSVDPIPALQRGWAFAILKPTSIQADDGAGLTDGIIGLMNHGRPRSLEDWGALKAWAWGAGRCLDYFATDRSLDARRVAIEGHSRYGKAVLVAMAYDPRFAVAYSSSSGEGGAKLYRHIYGEPIPNLASATEYHWMAGNFLKYDGTLNAGDLPVDNHELIALSAPRPVFIGAGSNNGDGYANPNGDAWADPRGMFLAEVAATPVYRLLGVSGIETSTFPPVETALVKGNLAFRQHSDGHTPKPNWPAFLSFASRYLNSRAASGNRN